MVYLDNVVVVYVSAAKKIELIEFIFGGLLDSGDTLQAEEM